MIRLPQRSEQKRILSFSRKLSIGAFVLHAVYSVPFATAQEDRAPVVVAEEVGAEPIVDQVQLTGTVTSPQVAQVSTSVDGLVQAVHVDAGDRVDRGAPLVDLDRELAELELERAAAATREAREHLADAQRRFDEAKRLEGNQSISQTELLSREAEVQVAMAAVARLEAAQRHQAARVARHSLAAPFPGVVSRKLTEAGEWVAPGTPIAELVALDGLRLDFRAPQAYFPRVDTQTPVSVRLDALPERRLDGRITAIIPVSDPEARTFLVRIHLDDDHVAMTPGMSAHALLDLKTGRRSTTALRDALIRYPDGRITVWVIEETDGEATVSERQVQTGLAFDGRVEIRSGLDAGERVVVRGNEALQEGQRVRLRGAAGATAP